MPLPSSSASQHRLRKHADYQRVYRVGRKQFAREMSFFFALRPVTGADGHALRDCPSGPRVGLTVPKALGKAHDRNRIKRRLREVVREALPLLTAPVDVILHPRRSALTLPFADLEREIAGIFRTIERRTQEVSSPNAATAGTRRHRRDTMPLQPTAAVGS